MLQEAKAYAQRSGVTLRQIIEEGIRRTVAQAQARPARRLMSDGSFPGGGEWLGLSSDEIRHDIYGGRGGE